MTKIGIQLESVVKWIVFEVVFVNIFGCYYFAAAILEAKRSVFRVNGFFPKAVKKVLTMIIF